MSTTFTTPDRVLRTPHQNPGLELNRPAWAALICGLAGLIPGLGILTAPLAVILGIVGFRKAEQLGSGRGPSLVGGLLGCFVVLLYSAVGLAIAGGSMALLGGNPSSNNLPVAGEENPKPKDSDKSEPSGETKKVKMGEGVYFETQGKQRRVLIEATVCRREGLLEHLLTRKRIKDHEAILTTEADGKIIHAALEAAGAKAGTTCEYFPKYKAPTGQSIRILVQYEHKGKLVTVPAQQWIKNAKTGKDLDAIWVFAGSQLEEHPDGPAKPKIYTANRGDLICISNIESAMLDLPIPSTKDNDDLQFEAHTDRIPELDTKVTIILEPVVVEMKDKKTDK